MWFGAHLLNKIIEESTIYLETDTGARDGGPVRTVLALLELRSRLQSRPPLHQIIILYTS